MTDQYLMECNNERMNVTPDKLDEYLAAGWKVLKTPQENKKVVVQDQPVVELPAVAVETAPSPAPTLTGTRPHQESADGDGSRKTRGKRG